MVGILLRSASANPRNSVRGAGADAFGAFQPEAVRVSQRLVDQMREISGSIAMSPEAREQLERKIIDSWIAAHPLRDLVFLRLVLFVAAAVVLAPIVAHGYARIWPQRSRRPSTST